MLIGDLDQALTAAVAALVGDGTLPATAADGQTGGSWRTDQGGDPARFASSLPFELGARSGREAAVVATALAPHVRQLSWVAAAAPSGDGYLTITVTTQALAVSAARQVAAGRAAARSTMLRGTTAAIGPWPDLTAAPSWRHAWQSQAVAMRNRLAGAAGAFVSVESDTTGERAGDLADVPRGPRPIAAAVAWFGLGSIRYRLARTVTGQVAQLGRQLRPGTWAPDPLYQVRHAYTHATSTLRWASDLRLDTTDPGPRAGELLDSAAERRLLGLLTWLPVRVASAARRNRPDVLPTYLEEVADAWHSCSQAAPALPFGGRAAPRDPAIRGARLLVADAVRTVLAAGLALTGVDSFEDREDHG